MSKYYLEISTDPGGDRKNHAQGREFYCGGFEAAILTQAWQKEKNKDVFFIIK